MDGDGGVVRLLRRGWSERIPQHCSPEVGHPVGVNTVETEIAEVRGRHSRGLRLCARMWSVPPLGAQRLTVSEDKRRTVTDQQAHLRRNIRLCVTPCPTISCMAMKKRANMAYLI